MFLNCLVCFSSRVDWSQNPLMSPVSELSALSSQTKQADDLLSYLKLKSSANILCEYFWQSGKSQSLVHLALWWLQRQCNRFLIELDSSLF